MAINRRTNGVSTQPTEHSVKGREQGDARPCAGTACAVQTLVGEGSQTRQAASRATPPVSPGGVDSTALTRHT